MVETPQKAVQFRTNVDGAERRSILQPGTRVQLVSGKSLATAIVHLGSVRSRSLHEVVKGPRG